MGGDHAIVGREGGTVLPGVGELPSRAEVVRRGRPREHAGEQQGGEPPRETRRPHDARPERCVLHVTGALRGVMNSQRSDSTLVIASSAQ